MVGLSRKTVVLIVLIALLLVVAGGFWLQHTARGGQRTIAVILASSVNPFWIDVRRGAEQAATELGEGFTVRIAASNDQDAGSQVALLNTFLARNAANALVLGPASDVETVPAVAKYSEANIPVILIDTELNASEVKKYHVNVAAFIGSDNRDGGRKAAEVMAGALKGPSRRVLLIEGSPVHQSAIDRSEGFREVADNEKIEVVRRLGEWKRDKAQQIVSAEFSRQHFDGIFAANDDMAVGAVAGLKAINVKQDEWPIVVGFDATRDGLTAVTSGEMYATIEQDARGLGAMKALMGEPLLPRAFLSVRVRRR